MIVTMRNGRHQGLSLIEVIVALVVISGFGAALFVWAGQTLQDRLARRPRCSSRPSWSATSPSWPSA